MYYFLKIEHFQDNSLLFRQHFCQPSLSFVRLNIYLSFESTQMLHSSNKAIRLQIMRKYYLEECKTDENE